MKRKFDDFAVTIIVATLNEEKGIGPTLEEIQKVLGNPHIIVVDGKSYDRTVEIAKKMGAKVVFQDGMGKGDAVQQGIKQINSLTRYVVFIDADFTYPAEYIPKMIEIMEQNPDVGMVIGNRFNNKFTFRKAISDSFYVGNRLLAYAQHLFNGIKLNDPLSGLRVVRAKILICWKPKSKGFDIEAEMNYYVERAGYQIVEIPIKYRPRLGNKKLKLRHGFTILRRIIAESFIK
ncbi:MAG: glycosyltransferase family 2 protein [Candidatus Bathyarchaeia archaeon]